MKVAVNEIKQGNIILLKGELWQVVKSNHVKPGKGPAYLQAELKNVKDDRKLNERFRTSDTLEKVRVDQEGYSYLYNDGQDYMFMHKTSFDQINISAKMLGDKAAFLKENMEVQIESYEGDVVNIYLPEQVTLEIIETEPTIKGQTATSSFKPAICENGIKVMVPQFIDAGEKIIVNSNNSEYVKRA